MKKDLTQGNILGILIKFSMPYLLSCFLQTFYGLADLFVIGKFNDASSISAVSIGSQVMHMVTVIIVGLAMGSTVTISRALGAKKNNDAANGIGNTIIVFSLFAVAATSFLILSTNGIIKILATPSEAVLQTRSYLLICFAGVPFITAYNVLSSIFRGIGDSKSPMYFVFVAGVINIFLDFLFIGGFKLSAAGAAMATVISQTLSVIFALIMLMKKDLGIKLRRRNIKFDRESFSNILKVGFPTACQDGFIQVSFLIITAIVNQRGVDAAAGVGIVEKIISFLFLVPSAMLSSISAIAAQNAGANLHNRSKQVLGYGIGIGVAFGIIVTIICQFQAEHIMQIFAKGESEVIRVGSEYLRTYVTDCIFAAVHFCFSGYFCAYKKAGLSFIQNALSVVLVRVPGAYLASVLFPATLYQMGMAAPLGSLLSAVICIAFFVMYREKYFE